MKHEVHGPLEVYHGTGPSFTELWPDKPIHVGSERQAQARCLGKMVVLDVARLYLLRKKDTGGGWPRKLRGVAARGFDGIVYLNRYEGVPLARTLALMAQGKSREYLDRISDAEFKKLVPEAHDSYLLCRAKCLTVKMIIEEPKKSVHNG